MAKGAPVSVFAEPQAFVLLLVLPALWLIGRHALRQRAESLRRFGDPALLAKSSNLAGRPASRLLSLVRMLALCALVAALARPEWGREPRTLARTGRDLIVALDLSRSMRATDVGGSRLSAAKRLAWQLAAARPGDRIGLVIFGGAGFLQLPPTSDLSTFQLFLDQASFDDIGDPATDLAAGLKVAERVLRREGTAIESRAVLLLSDGERSEGPLDPILELYQKAKLPVFAVGVGTATGARVPGDSGSPTGPWHLDNIGRPVISKLDEVALRRIAQESGEPTPDGMIPPHWKSPRRPSRLSRRGYSPHSRQRNRPSGTNGRWWPRCFSCSSRSSSALGRSPSQPSLGPGREPQG